MNTHTIEFTRRFDRALAACAQAQVLLRRSADAVSRSREVRAPSRRIRRLALDTREAWHGADRINATMRRQVVEVASAMRVAGMSEAEAAVAMRAHMRFELYVRGLREIEAEPVVARAAGWVGEAYRPD